MFESIVAGLMMERPEDPLKYMDKRLDQIKEKGVHFVNWETFVYHLHPRRDSIHLKLVHDPVYSKTMQPEKEETSKDMSKGLEQEKYELQARCVPINGTNGGLDVSAHAHKSGQIRKSVFLALWKGWHAY